MTKSKAHKPKRKKREEEHPEHSPVSMDELGAFVSRLVRVPPPRKTVKK